MAARAVAADVVRAGWILTAVIEFSKLVLEMMILYFCVLLFQLSDHGLLAQELEWLVEGEIVFFFIMVSWPCLVAFMMVMAFFFTISVVAAV